MSGPMETFSLSPASVGGGKRSCARKLRSTKKKLMKLKRKIKKMGGGDEDVAGLDKAAAGLETAAKNVGGADLTRAPPTDGGRRHSRRRGSRRTRRGSLFGLRY